MTIKLSYTLLNNWMSGRFEEAVAQYLGKPLIPTSAMELGRLKHKEWEQYINKTGELPNELGGGMLNAPQTEVKYEERIELGPHNILFRGVIDLETDNVLTDFKCGLGSPSYYLNSWQLDAYGFLRPEAKEGRYLCFNPYDGTHSVGIKFLNLSSADRALKNIITYGSEMLDYLMSQRLAIDLEKL